jgi:hypothetical protein
MWPGFTPARGRPTRRSLADYCAAAYNLELVHGQKAALEPLFNVLSDDQKKAADETLTRVMKVGMSMGGGGMDHGSMSHSGMSHGGMGGMMGGMGGMSHGGGMQH